MDLCPICRAQLHGADICRRCRADLAKIRQVVRQSDANAGAAMHLLALGGRRQDALRQLSRANALRAAPDLAWLMSNVGRERRADPPGLDDDEA